MKSLNVYINEAWGGVKQQSIKADIEAWCDEMGIKKYNVNDIKGDPIEIQDKEKGTFRYSKHTIS